MLLGILENEIEALERQREAREQGGPCVVLMSAMSGTTEETAGWFGGAPKLPAKTKWPHIDDEPLRFLCQIDLSKLPRRLWGGVGPRHGWLAFFVHPIDYRPHILHVMEPLSERDGPGQSDAGWFRRWSPEAQIEDPLSPKWPFYITERSEGRVVSQEDAREELYGPSLLFKADFADLSRPEIHPFDEVTLNLLVSSLEEYLQAKQRQIERFISDKKLHAKDAAELARLADLNSASIGRFEVVKAQMYARDERLRSDEDLCLLEEIHELPISQIIYRKNDEDGFADLDISIRRLGDRPDRGAGPLWWFELYASVLYQRALSAYSRDPERLPSPLRHHMEQTWILEADRSRAAMAHSPEGHIYTPYGPATPNEVLLELPSNPLTRWIWGDCYSIVFVISRKDLAKGKFNRVTFDITN
ncbi:MAG: hypothetical protein CML67_05765 [Rhodobacteraceae bacterium]|nr:hypothetical protein [Paracoccaceae bacterium]